MGKTPPTRAFGGKHPESPTSDGEEDGPILGSMGHDGGAKVVREEKRLGMCGVQPVTHVHQAGYLPTQPETPRKGSNQEREKKRKKRRRVGKNDAHPTILGGDLHAKQDYRRVPPFLASGV